MQLSTSFFPSAKISMITGIMRLQHSICQGGHGIKNFTVEVMQHSILNSEEISLLVA